MATGKTKEIPLEGHANLVVQEDQPLDWFEDLYSASDTEGGGVPWANMETHPLFVDWLQGHPLDGKGKRALVVGCGMGDDAVELESLGYDVTAFDVSDSAIRYCRQRFPDSDTDFLQADLLAPPAEWKNTFDVVLEVYTVQAMPPAWEDDAIRNIASFVAPGGQLLVIAEVGEGERSFDSGPPWLLTPAHVESFSSHGLEIADQYIKDTDDNGMTSYTTTFIKV